MRIRAILRFRNEDLTRKRLIAGFKTQKELADFIGVNQNIISSWETLKSYPQSETLIDSLEIALNCDIYDIFPPEIIKAINEKIGIPIEKVVSVKQLPSFTRGEYLLPSPEDIFERKELEKNVEDWLGGLRERERKIIEMRFGLGKYRGTKCTLREIAAQMGVGGARIRQIEAKAKNKLRNIHQSKKMLSSQGLI